MTSAKVQSPDPNVEKNEGVSDVGSLDRHYRYVEVPSRESRGTLHNHGASH